MGAARGGDPGARDAGQRVQRLWRHSLCGGASRTIAFTMRSKANPRSAPVKTALARAEPPEEVHLDADGRQLLAEALRRAEETRDVMEDALVRFGRWLLVNVFDDDAAAALDDRRLNPVWSDLLARAGGPTLRLSPRLLYVALHIAARDKRITDGAWRALEPGRKQMLLPLGDEGLMRGRGCRGCSPSTMIRRRIVRCWNGWLRPVCVIRQG